jgi:RNA polymerase sigma factor (sigma-70 family)
MGEIPKLIRNIARRHARIHWTRNYKFAHSLLDPEDYIQSIYEKLWRDNLWSCTDSALIGIVAKRACLNTTRAMFPGYRQKKIHSVVEFEEQACRIFDDHFYEIESLQQLIAALDPTKKMIAEWICEGHTLKEIGKMINVTEARISQIRKEIIERLHRLYLKPPFKKSKPIESKSIESKPYQAKIIPFNKQRSPSKRTCSEPGCILPLYARGKCKKTLYARVYATIPRQKE